MSVLYTASATSLGGRDGSVKTADGLIDVKVAMPKELGGQGGATNPEELFAAGYAACFHGALKMVAGNEKISLRDSKVVVQVGIGPDATSFGLEVDIKASVPTVDAAKARELIEKAHQVCPYSKATRGNIPVTVGLLETVTA